MSNEFGKEKKVPEPIDLAQFAEAGILRCGSCAELANEKSRFCGSCGSPLNSFYGIVESSVPNLMWLDGIWRAADSLSPVEGGLVHYEEKTSKNNRANKSVHVQKSLKIECTEKVSKILEIEAKRKLKRSVIWAVVSNIPLIIFKFSIFESKQVNWLLVIIAITGWLAVGKSIYRVLYPRKLIDYGA
jgi:hypothetical protein